MTTLEMHIALDIICQKLNSNVYGNLLPEEKDIILNKAQLRFIRNVTEPTSNAKQQGFEYTQARYDDIEELLTPIVLPSFVYTEGGNLDESVFNILPYNYLRLVRMRSLTKDLCGADYTTNVEIVAKTLEYYVIPFTESVSLFDTFMISFVDDVLGSYDLFDINDYPEFSAGLNSNEEKFLLINLILEEVNKVLVSIGSEHRLYWQSFYNVFQSNSFILVCNDDVSSVVYTIDEDVYTLTGSTDSISLDEIGNASTGFSAVPHRITKSNDIISMLETSFYTTIPTSPLTEIEKGKLISYHKKRFIIGNVMLQYIRKPRIISLNSSIDCELNPNVHDKVVDIASQMIANYLNLGTQKNIIMENILKE